MPVARVEHVGAADQDVGGRRWSRWSSRLMRAPPASTPARLAARVAAREQLVEHRHPDDDAGLDLLADHGLRRVDHLGGELDAAVDRAGVHEHLARRRAGGR